MIELELEHGGVIGLDAIADRITEPWMPVDVARLNDSMLRMARLEGSFPWHHHDKDEAFLCWRGEFRIEQEGSGPVHLGPGELYVVRRGVRHRPVADAGSAWTLLIERPETKQYGEEVAR